MDMDMDVQAFDNGNGQRHKRGGSHACHCALLACLILDFGRLRVGNGTCRSALDVTEVF